MVGFQQNLLQVYNSYTVYRDMLVGPIFNKTASLNDAGRIYPVGIYLLQVNNRNTRTRCEICSKLTIRTPERRHWRRSGVFIVNSEHISHLVLVFLLLTLSR